MIVVWPGGAHTHVGDEYRFWTLFGGYLFVPTRSEHAMVSQVYTF